MIRITCINQKNERFDKCFENQYLADKFINKAKRGTSLVITAVTKE
jgi:hypothetical protein